MNNILHEFAVVEHLVLLVPLVEFFGGGLLPVVDGIHVRSAFYSQEVEGMNLVVSLCASVRRGESRKCKQAKQNTFHRDLTFLIGKGSQKYFPRK